MIPRRMGTFYNLVCLFLWSLSLWSWISGVCLWNLLWKLSLDLSLETVSGSVSGNCLWICLWKLSLETVSGVCLWNLSLKSVSGVYLVLNTSTSHELNLY